MSSNREDFTLDDLVYILEYLESSDWEVFELQTRGINLYISKTPPVGDRETPTGRGHGQRMQEVAWASASPEEGSGNEARTAEASTSSTQEVSTPETDTHHIVRAPMVGTFYRAPEPGAAPYVDVGTVVEPGDTIGLLEVMKLFHTVTTDVGGKVLEVTAEEAHLVEYGEPLIVIEVTQERW